MRRCITLLLVIGLLFSCCRSPNEPVPLRSPEISGPTVSGIYIMDEYGNELGSWGNLSFPHDPNGRLSMDNPYPNPNNGDVTIGFVMWDSLEIDMWIVPASYPGEDVDREMLIAEGIFLPAKGLSVRTLIENEYQGVGYYNVVWDGRNDDGERLPTGFYRIYLRGNNTLIWRDVLFINELIIPPGMMKILNQIIPMAFLEWRPY